MFTPEMKRASKTMVNDKNTKMSTRVLYFIYYMTIRACEIIDWWFPTEQEKLQRKRAKVCMNDPPGIPKGATVKLDPKTGAAIEEKYQ